MIAVAPWYGQVPASLARWRITGTWLNEPLHWPELATRPFELAWSLLAGGSYWGGSSAVDATLAALYVLLALWLLRGAKLTSLFSIRPPADLAVGGARGARALRASIIVRHTGASRVPRYALAALPAAMLLVALRGSAAVRSDSCGVHRPGSGGLDRWARAHRSAAARPGAAYPALASELERRMAARWRDPGALGPIGRHRAEPRAHAGAAVPRLDRAAWPPEAGRSGRAPPGPPPGRTDPGPQHRPGLTRRALARRARSVSPTGGSTTAAPTP